MQGLGYVGTAMLAALSQAKDDDNECSYNVIGIDLGDENNYWKIGRVNEGKSPVVSSDEILMRLLKEVWSTVIFLPLIRMMLMRKQM